MTDDTMRGTPIAWPLRAWLGVEILFGLASMATISLDPANSATNFAWPIKPNVTAAVLGAFYMSSAWVFVIAFFARRWEMIRAMMIPAILFTATELLATLLHWDKFRVGTTPFNVWFASYLLPPIVLGACHVWQQRHRVADPARGLPLDPRLVTLLTVGGWALAVFAVAAFLYPRLAISLAPVALTPLTARALGGWVLALGAMMLTAARENDRDRARIVAPFFILLGPAVAWQVGRFAGDTQGFTLAASIWITILLAVLVAGLMLARGDWRRTLS